MKPIIYPYKMGSSSAKLLAKELGALRVYPDRSYRPRSNHIIINWGNSVNPRWKRIGVGTWINDPTFVQDAGNKLRTFEILHNNNNVSIPEFTTVIEEAKNWDGVVVCRQTLTGSQGRGIVIAQSPEEIVPALLYTKHVRHKHEFRVHVFQDKVIDFTQKKKRSGLECNNYVRNSAGNWVFCREGITLPEDVSNQAIAAVSALGLDFGAVDVAYREREDKAYVLEVNTAPGMDEDGTTLKRYTEAFKEILNV